MASIFPKGPPQGDSEETRRLFMEWSIGQEAEFPLADPSDDAWKAKLVAHMEKYVHPDVVLHGVPVKRPGRDGWLEFMMGLGEAYPDSETTIDALTVEGDTVCAFWTYRATQRAALMGHGEMGRRIEVSGAFWERFRDGKLIEHAAMMDRLGWLKQMGALDPSVDM